MYFLNNSYRIKLCIWWVIKQIALARYFLELWFETHFKASLFRHETLRQSFYLNNMWLKWATSQVHRFNFQFSLFLHIYIIFTFVALIKFIRPVFVSRSDPDSRRKTVEEIKRRACSAGKWPQVTHTLICSLQPQWWWLGSWAALSPYSILPQPKTNRLSVWPSTSLSNRLLFFCLIACLFLSVCGEYLKPSSYVIRTVHVDMIFPRCFQ